MTLDERKKKEPLDHTLLVDTYIAVLFHQPEIDQDLSSIMSRAAWGIGFDILPAILPQGRVRELFLAVAIFYL